MTSTVENETEFKKWFIDKWLRGADIIEFDLTDNPGVPDVNYCLRGQEGWIEFKWIKKKKGADIRPAQIAWFRNRVEAGGRCFLVWGHPDGDYGLIHGDEVHKLGSNITLRKVEMFSHPVRDETLTIKH